MDSELSWLSEMGLENSIVTMDQWDLMDSFDEEVAALLGHELDNSPSSSTLINIPSSNSITSMAIESPPLGTAEPPPKLLKPNNFSTFTSINNHPINPTSSTPIMLNFDNTTEINPQHHAVSPQSRPLNPDEEAAVSQVLRAQGPLPEPEDQSKRPLSNKRPSRIRPPSQTYDHIIAERKRREQLSQRFVALSTIIPGLKKMDKTSVLGDAIKYLKHLQERVKTLEEQATRQTMESVVLVKRSQIMAEDEGSSDEKSGGADEMPLPEIEARVCNNHILLRLHCEKHKGVLVNLLCKVEKLNLAIISTNVTPFGTFALDITIIAEMEKDFNLTMREVVKRLRAAL